MAVTPAERPAATYKLILYPSDDRDLKLAGPSSRASWPLTWYEGCTHADGIPQIIKSCLTLVLLGNRDFRVADCAGNVLKFTEPTA